jgi:molybdopterin converting factor small subunit
MEDKQFSVQVRFLGALALYAGARQISMDVPAGSSLEWLLNRLEEVTPPAYADLLKQGSGDNTFLRIMLNNKLIRQNNQDVPLSQGDIVTLLPAISGGA